MSSRVDQKQPKEQDIVVMQLETVKQHDAGFDQDRYMDGINYIDKRRGALDQDPDQGINGDMYFNIPNQEVRVFVSWFYTGVGILAWAAATAYTREDYVDNGGTAYKAIRDFTSGGAFDITNWVEVERVALWKPVA